MKKNSCKPINHKKYSCCGLKKIHTRNLITKKNSCGSKIPLPPPHNFSNGPSLNGRSRQNTQVITLSRSSRSNVLPSSSFCRPVALNQSQLFLEDCILALQNFWYSVPPCWCSLKSSFPFQGAVSRILSKFYQRNCHQIEWKIKIIALTH